jgi:hypothetical protein
MLSARETSMQHTGPCLRALERCSNLHDLVDMHLRVQAQEAAEKHRLPLRVIATFLCDGQTEAKMFMTLIGGFQSGIAL